MTNHDVLADLADMPRGGPTASWLDRRLQTDALEYTDRRDVPEKVRQRVVDALDEAGTRRGWHRINAALVAGEVREIDRPRILELGAAHGKLSAEVLALLPSAQVTISDLDPMSVNNIDASPLGQDPRVTTKVIDAADIDAEDDAFDLVVLAAAFHHLPPNLAVRAIMEATRVGKRFLVVDLKRLPEAAIAIAALAAIPLIPVALLSRSLRPLAHDLVITTLRSYSPSALQALGSAADPGMNVRFLPRSRAWPPMMAAVFSRS